MLSIGADTRLIQPIPNKNPLIIARLKLGEFCETKKSSKIIVYGHYDVQPVVSELWNTPPFTLTGVNGYLYGRGASDNKGPITAMIVGAKELIEEDLNVEIIFLLDGEEEAGFETGGFKEAVKSNVDLLNDADVIVIANTYWIGTEKPCLVYGMRGSIHLSLNVQGPSNNLHSGVHGGAFYEPMNDLIHLLSMLVDENGEVLVPGFFDNVRGITQEEMSLYEKLENHFDLNDYMHSLGVQKLKSSNSTEILMNRWRQPSLCIHGIHSSYPGQHGTVAAISKSCSASLSIRTVPDQKVEDIVNMLKEYLTKKFESFGTNNKLSLELVSSGNWWLGNPFSTYFQAAESAIKQQWGVDPLYIREGGTLPTSSFLESTLKAPVVHIPFGQITDQAHLENERIRIRNLIKGKDVFKDFVRKCVNLKNAP